MGRDARIWALAEQGISQREIAREVGIDEKTVRNRLIAEKRNPSEIPHPPTPPTAIDWIADPRAAARQAQAFSVIAEKISALADQGMSQIDIALEVGVAEETVRNVVSAQKRNPSEIPHPSDESTDQEVDFPLDEVTPLEPSSAVPFITDDHSEDEISFEEDYDEYDQGYDEEEIFGEDDKHRDEDLSVGDQAKEMEVMDDGGDNETIPSLPEHQSTGSFHVSKKNNDWYTPERYVEAGRTVMGGIDLDPASSDIANKVVQAKAYFTAENDGLEKDWHGRVWMNPPFSMPLVQQFVDKLIAEWRSGRIKQATVITNNATDTGWFHDLLSEAGIACLTRGRVRFYSPKNDGMAPRQGQAFFYLGPRKEQFIETFENFGALIRL